jgi:hypothetical protein
MACNERVGKGVITYPCTLAENHPGPCMSTESTASQNQRRRWETEQAEKIRHAESGLAQFQGVAQTTAQRYTENPTDVPVSAGRSRLHSGCSSVACLVYDGEAGDRQSAWRECPFATTPPPREQHAPFTVTIDRGTPNEEPVLVAHDGNNVTFTRGIPAEVTMDARGMVPLGKDIPLPPPTKQREGDQPLPVVNDHPDIQSMVIADIEKRRQVGISRYGTALQPHNGRDMLLDLYEELMDAAIYIKGVMVERDNPR